MWGMELSLDLFECNHGMVRNEAAIRIYVKQLCKKLGVTPYGRCVVKRFGETERVAGFSMTQLIDTSLVSGHFVDATNAAYLNVFSCREFDPKNVVEFSSRFFEAKHLRWLVNHRG